MIFQQLSGQIALVKNFSEIFQNDNGSLESMLIQAGIQKNVIDLILDGYINVNRVIWKVKYYTSNKNLSEVSF